MIRVLMLAAAALAAAPAIASPPLQIEEWTVPWEKSRPRDPYADAQGRVWFVGQAGNYIAYLDPASGRFKRYEIEEGTHPHNLIVDRAGQVWFAGNRNGMIGRLDPRSGAIERYSMPDPAAGDPHTLVFDRSGNIWFTVQQGNFVGKLETGSGKVRLVDAETGEARTRFVGEDEKREYARLLAEHCAAWKTWCFDREINYVRCSSSAPLEEVVRVWLRESGVLE